MMRDRNGEPNSFPASASSAGVTSKLLRVPVLALILSWGGTVVQSFQPCVGGGIVRYKKLLFSSVGPPDSGGDGKFDEFFNPKEESEALFKAREFMNENSLPLSYGRNATAVVDEEDFEEEELDDQDVAMVAMTSKKDLAQNPYVDIVSKISPSEMISKFSTTAHPRVQSAVRNTILGLLGGLPKMAFDTTTVTTGQKLASLMFQLQMTGYMFKNADYRLSVEQSLGGSKSDLLKDKFVLPGESPVDPLAGKVRGKLRVHFAEQQASEVDAAAYMSELRTEVSKLRDELVVTQKQKNEAVRKDLLMYIRTLPQQELQSLTNTMSQDVLVAMKGLVNAVLSGIGDGEIGPGTVTEQSSEAMAQLCMWQLVIGYNLRTLEVREEIKKSLKGASGDADGGISMEPGSME